MIDPVFRDGIAICRNGDLHGAVLVINDDVVILVPGVLRRGLLLHDLSLGQSRLIHALHSQRRGEQTEHHGQDHEEGQELFPKMLCQFFHLSFEFLFLGIGYPLFW